MLFPTAVMCQQYFFPEKYVQVLCHFKKIGLGIALNLATAQVSLLLLLVKHSAELNMSF